MDSHVRYRTPPRTGSAMVLVGLLSVTLPARSAMPVKPAILLREE
jgi:hypothetical protein